jgi:surfeit locus 1 family protein
MTAVARDDRPLRSIIVAGLCALVVFVILIGLGTWQVRRLAWKEALIADLNTRLAASPMALPAPAVWPELRQSALEYRHVKFTATFENDKEAHVYAAPSTFRRDVSGPGYWIFTPAKFEGGLVMVNRGFVPEGRQDPKTRLQGQVTGPVDIVGTLRWPEARGMFTSADDPAHNLWFVRDPLAIAAEKGLGPVAPFYVEQETPQPPGGLPHAGPLRVVLPNNHLQYAITWFGLAAALVGVFSVWTVRRWRESRPGYEEA